jgi:hypothetical protein
MLLNGFVDGCCDLTFPLQNGRQYDLEIVHDVKSFRLEVRRPANRRQDFSETVRLEKISLLKVSKTSWNIAGFETGRNNPHVSFWSLIKDVQCQLELLLDISALPELCARKED